MVKGSVNPVVNPFQQQADFYNNPNTALNPIANQGNTYFYSKTNFEPSPLNRPLETFAPGNSWVGSEAQPTKRSVKMGYFINTATDAVRIWNVADPAPTVTFGSYTSTASYPAGEL
ncbi:MAG: hypothetical protein EAY75_16205, partial [Bacteroidetes bacterium]